MVYPSSGSWQSRVLDFVARQNRFPKGSPESIRFNALALAGEAGELANIVKKEWRGDADKAYWPKFAAELADVFICAQVLANEAGVSVEAICNAKLDELDRRFAERGFPYKG